MGNVALEKIMAGYVFKFNPLETIDEIRPKNNKHAYSLMLDGDEILQTIAKKRQTKPQVPVFVQSTSYVRYTPCWG